MDAPFENRKDIKRDYSFSDLVLLIKILNYNKEITHESKIARDIGCYPQRLTKILKYLKKIKIIKNEGIIGSSKLIKIDYFLLKEFIDEQDVHSWLTKNYLNRFNKYIFKRYAK